jgi:quercetin dioxygenase-like cupin family protein
MTPHCVDWTAIPEERSPSGIGKRTIAGAGASLVRVQVPAGTVAPRHSHPHEQFVQVISGSGELETEQGTRAFAAGSVFHFPAESWHAARFDSDTVLVETNLPG